MRLSALNLSVSTRALFAGRVALPIGTPAVRTGTSPLWYSYVGTGLRENVTTGSGGDLQAVDQANRYHIRDKDMWSAEWDVTDPLICFSPYAYAPGGGTSFVSKGSFAATIEVVNVIWDGVSHVATSVTPNRIDTSTGEDAFWIKLAGITVPANKKITIRFAYVFDDIPGQTFPKNAYTAYTGGQSKSSATSLATAATGAGAISQPNNPNTLVPVKMAAKGGDGRKCVMLTGDSKGYGRDQAAHAYQLNARLESGYASIGLDRNDGGAKRLPFANCCISGQNVENFGNAALMAGMLAMTDKLVALNGGVMPYDVLLSQHGTNSITGGALLPTLIQSYRDMYGLWRSRGGAPAVPIAQLELTTYAGAGTDAFATLEGQNLSARGFVDRYPDGIRWQLNAAIGGPDGLGDPNAALRNGVNAITWSEAPWRDGAADTGVNRDKWPIAPLNTTLAAAWTGSGPARVNGQFNGKLHLQIKGDNGNWYYGIVSAVTDNGDGTSTVASVAQGGGSAAAAGNVVRGVYAGGSGLHESAAMHEIESAAVVRLKIAMGEAA
ncbi:hypothetical protein [Sphingomonas pituitosa]|uniref:hypothetical protein n=1 Tax=Sphingomonas pituitosa TaxID=99597 RepID=UPI000A8BAC01|nr:hypothetical protein [Sphingomonas pituitosa]